MNFLLETLRLGLANLLLHKLRSLLTMLGIIIGVAAVVAMAAYTEGSKQRVLADIRQLGARNIICRSEKPPESNTNNDNSNSRRMTTLAYGLTNVDVKRLRETVEGVTRLVPLKQVSTRATRMRYQTQAAVYGCTPDLLEVTNLQVARGRYLTETDGTKMENVAVIGAEVAERLFPLVDPLNEEIRVSGQVFKVVGVLRRVGLAAGRGSALVGRDLNFDVHIPMSTARTRFGDTLDSRSAGTQERTRVEVSDVYIQVAREDQVRAVAEQIKAVIALKHEESKDVMVHVPLELLEQQEQNQRIFSILMIIIAGLGLLVGGIGIMNIMLASVTERTREIGIRRALGATRRHIIWQFLVETTVLSGIGGLIGVAMGVGGALLITLVRWLWSVTILEEPQVTTWSIVVSFAVATSTGIIFGLYPAIQAARQDPIVALRHD